jgi:hypothetical protein
MQLILNAGEDLELRHFDSPGMEIECGGPSAPFGAMRRPPRVATPVAVCAWDRRPPARLFPDPSPAAMA